jgi:hypothetical protein
VVQLTETLNDAELDIIFFIERFAATNGHAPTTRDIKQRFNGVTDDFLGDFQINPLVVKSLRMRGIVYPAMQDKLTDPQMHAIAAMLDPYDRRSDEKKLRDIGITTRQWAMWLLDDEFALYVNDRAERLLKNTTFEAHKGVLKAARNGNIAGAKLHYEVTGRHRPDQDQQIDVRAILHTFIEIIQRYVPDPVVMHRIATDLSRAASAESLSTGLTNQMMSTSHSTISGSAQVHSSIPIPRSIGGADDD